MGSLASAAEKTKEVIRRPPWKPSYIRFFLFSLLYFSPAGMGFYTFSVQSQIFAKIRKYQLQLIYQNIKHSINFILVLY